MECTEGLAVRSGADASQYTLTRSSLVLQPRDDRSLAYRFMPHPMLEVGEFGLYGQVYYHDWENMNYTTVFFNQTIDLVDPPSALDSDTCVPPCRHAAVDASPPLLLGP